MQINKESTVGSEIRSENVQDTCRRVKKRDIVDSAKSNCKPFYHFISKKTKTTTGIENLRSLELIP